MQSLEARTRYSNSFNCVATTLREEGVLAFWRGATPRLARLVLSGGIVFTVVRTNGSGFSKIRRKPLTGSDLVVSLLCALCVRA